MLSFNSGVQDFWASGGSANPSGWSEPPKLQGALSLPGRTLSAYGACFLALHSRVSGSGFRVRRMDQKALRQSHRL